MESPELGRGGLLPEVQSTQEGIFGSDSYAPGTGRLS